VVDKEGNYDEWWRTMFGREIWRRAYEGR